VTDNQFFIDIFEDSILCKSNFIRNNASDLVSFSRMICHQLKHDKKLLIFGNGGSAADAQHLAAELVNRLSKRYRPALPAIALTTDSSILTSIANDSSFSKVFSRQIEALGEAGDVALGISTSGNSHNIVEAIAVAREKGLKTAALLGGNGGEIRSMVDYSITVPSNSAQRVQEIHITICHALCEWIENQMFPVTNNGSITS
jgi:D-sedoheptulose 7-phosphate isomerase